MQIMSDVIEAARNAMNARAEKASIALRAFPRGITGLTPDHVRVSPEWQTAKQNYNAAFAELRAFNTKYKPPPADTRQMKGK